MTSLAAIGVVPHTTKFVMFQSFKKKNLIKYQIMWLYMYFKMQQGQSGWEQKKSVSTGVHSEDRAPFHCSVPWHSS